jgi:hypothetical protein
MRLEPVTISSNDQHEIERAANEFRDDVEKGLSDLERKIILLQQQIAVLQKASLARQ